MLQCLDKTVMVRVKNLIGVKPWNGYVIRQRKVKIVRFFWAYARLFYFEVLYFCILDKASHVINFTIRQQLAVSLFLFYLIFQLIEEVYIWILKLRLEPTLFPLIRRIFCQDIWRVEATS